MDPMDFTLFSKIVLLQTAKDFILLNNKWNVA